MLRSMSWVKALEGNRYYFKAGANIPSSCPVLDGAVFDRYILGIQLIYG